MVGYCPHCLSPIAWEQMASAQPGEVECPECGHIFRHEGLATTSGRSTAAHERTAEEQSAEQPTTFGPYQVVGMIGQGGMGRVYKAQHIQTGEEIAVKTVRSATRGLLQRMRREIQALSRMRHPGVVQFVAAGLGESVPWYGMELLQGATLHDYLQAVTTQVRPSGAEDSEPASVPTVPERPVCHDPSPALLPRAARCGLDSDLTDFLTLMARVCSALAYLHGEGIVHRDLKPKNIVRRPDGTPVIVDFGLASPVNAGGRETVSASGHAEGTPAYMAPEQIRGEYVDARADLYAVGCILYKGVTGRTPFASFSVSDLMEAQEHHQPIPPSQLIEPIAPALEELILRLLAKNARERLGHARDVVAVLAELGADPGDWLTRWPAQNYLYRPRFVGREGNLELLQSYLRRAHTGENRCVFVRGESGVGKTRLILELARRLEQDNVQVFSGECLPVNVATEGGGPEVRASLLHPFRPLLQAIADLCLEEGRAEFDRLVGPRARLLAVIEPMLATLEGPAPPSPGEASAAELHHLLDALGQTLAAFGRRTPFVVFLDDLQWADELTWKFLKLLHAGAWDGPGFALVCTYRSEEEQQALRLHRSLLSAAPVLKLDRFDETLVGAIVRDMLGVTELDERFVRFLAQRSEGNPFFIAEYLRTAVAEGLLQRDQAGRWRLAALSDADLAEAEGRKPSGLTGGLAPFRFSQPEQGGGILLLPASLRQLVARRLEGLPPNARAVVELAAVLGREVEADLLQLASALPDADFLEAMTVLVRRQVFEEREVNHYRFDHDKLREIAYEQIATESRCQLHARVAQVIESRHGASEHFAQFYATLAHHWRRSFTDRLADPENTARAINYLESASQQCLFSGLHRQAVEFGLEAARLLGVDLPTDPRQIRPMLARDVEDIGRLMAGRAPAALVELPPATQDSSRAIAILLRIQPAAYISQQFDVFACLAAKNMVLILRHGQTPLAPCVYSMFAVITRLLSDDSHRALEFSELAMELDRKQGGQFTSMVTFVHTWFINHWKNALHENLPISLQGLAGRVPGGGCPVWLLSPGRLSGLSQLVRGPLAEVISAAQAHHDLIGNRISYAAFHCLLELQLARALAGQTSGPLSLTDDQVDEARDLEAICRTESYNQMAYYFLTRLRLEYYYRNYQAALACATRLVPLRAAFQGQVAEGDYCFFHALALIAQATTLHGEERGRHLAQAQELLAQLERWAQHCPANYRHKALLVGAELQHAQDPAKEAGPLYDAAAQAAFESRFLHHAALAQELAGLHYLRSGDRERARRCLEQACGTYQQWGAVAKVKDVSQLLAAVYCDSEK